MQSGLQWIQKNSRAAFLALFVVGVLGGTYLLVSYRGTGPEQGGRDGFVFFDGAWHPALKEGDSASLKRLLPVRFSSAGGDEVVSLSAGEVLKGSISVDWLSPAAQSITASVFDRETYAKIGQGVFSLKRNEISSEGFVPFEGTVTYSAASSTDGFLLFDAGASLAGETPDAHEKADEREITAYSISVLLIPSGTNKKLVEGLKQSKQYAAQNASIRIIASGAEGVALGEGGVGDEADVVKIEKVIGTQTGAAGEQMVINSGEMLRGLLRTDILAAQSVTTVAATVVDSKKLKTIGSGTLSLKRGETSSDGFVPFEGTVTYSGASSTDGFLLFEADGTSVGSSIPVILIPSGTDRKLVEGLKMSKQYNASEAVIRILPGNETEQMPAGLKQSFSGSLRTDILASQSVTTVAATVVDSKKLKTIGSGTLSLKRGETSSDGFVPFEGTVTYSGASSTDGFLLFEAGKFRTPQGSEATAGGASVPFPLVALPVLGNQQKQEQSSIQPSRFDTADASIRLFPSGAGTGDGSQTSLRGAIHKDVLGAQPTPSISAHIIDPKTTSVIGSGSFSLKHDEIGNDGFVPFDGQITQNGSLGSEGIMLFQMGAEKDAFYAALVSLDSKGRIAVVQTRLEEKPPEAATPPPSSSSSSANAASQQDAIKLERISVVPRVGQGPLTPPLAKDGECRITGCNREVCADRDSHSSCEQYLPEYACYAGAVCERQSNGACGWTQTKELAQCIEGVQRAGTQSSQ